MVHRLVRKSERALCKTAAHLQGGRMGVTGALIPHMSALNDTCRQYKLIKRSNGPARLDAVKRQMKV